MDKNKIKVALLGLGRIGQMHAQNLFDHNEFNLKYIFDIDNRLGKKFSKKYNCISIIKPKIALNDKKVKIIFIATSTKSHLKFIQAAVKEKKIVFCEKPLDLDLKKINICKKKISSFTEQDVSINLVEIRKPEVEAQLIADNIAEQLERRVSFRRAMKRSVQSAMRLGAEGIRVNCGGRLGGTEIARTEWFREGRVPLHTFRANVDYAESTAATTYGACGIKVWIYKGDIDENVPHEKSPNSLG